MNRSQEEKPMTTIPITVDAKAAWYNTKIVFVKSQSYSITATGNVYPWDGANPYSPNGDPSIQWQYSLSPVHNFCMLIGRVGPTGTAFAVGASSGPIIPTATGELYLAMNDGVNFGDNSRQFNAIVTVPSCVPLSSLSGSVQVKGDRIDAELMPTWGVMLTVQCDVTDDAIRWTPTQKQNLINAFSSINTRLLDHTNKGFRSVFGGIELRHVGSLTPSTIGADTPSAQNGYLMRVGPVGRGGTTRNVSRAFGEVNTGAYGVNVAGDLGIKATITHELGHAFDYRTRPQPGQSANGLYFWGQQYNLTSVKGTSNANDIGRVWENPNGTLGENVPDHFLNWVFDTTNGYIITDPDVYNPAASDNARRISAYWIGGINFVELGVTRGMSAGIQTWADLANARAQVGLQELDG